VSGLVSSMVIPPNTAALLVVWLDLVLAALGRLLEVLLMVLVVVVVEVEAIALVLL
jgi:hypothetical protein